jgi:ABC-2 type transport system permease protein
VSAGRAYASLARMSARTVLTYRASFVLGLFAVFFQLLAMLYIWRLLLAGGTTVNGFTWPAMKAYLLIAFATGSLVSAYGDFRMASRIRDGLVALDLVKPIDYQTARFAETVGRGALELAVTFGVCAVIAVGTGGVPLPTPTQAALFALSVLAVVPLKFLIVYVTTLLCFWTQNYLGVSWARTSVTALFSGALVPLVFLPGWLQVTAAVLPFAGLTATPAAIYLGTARGLDAAALIVVQLAWVGVLWFVARKAWNTAVRQLTVHGG